MSGERPSQAPGTTTPLATEPRRAAPARRLLVLAAVTPLVLITVWALVLSLVQVAPDAARIGTAAPSFALADLDGKPVRLEDLRGRPLVVNFWASWCAPCVEEFPLLRAALATHGDSGLAIIGIVYRDRSEAARAFMARMGATWPAAMDPGETVARQYGILSPPESYFIGRDGIVAGRQIGQLSAADLDRQLSLILGEE